MVIFCHAAKISVSKPLTENITLSPANTTEGCIDAAIHIAVINFIREVIKQQSKQMSNLQCILTGGDADSIAKNLTVDCLTMPNLVLSGLVYVAQH